MGPLIQRAFRNDCAFLKLNRPERHNSLVPDLLRELLAALGPLAVDPSVRCVVLEGEGRSFSTGGDVEAFQAAGDQVESYARELVGLLNESILALMDLPCPVVVGAQGWITGGSLGFLLGGDIVVLAEDARIAPFYTDVGFSPDGGWGTLVGDVIGKRRAAEVQYLNQVISARRAVDWGLANRVVPRDQLGGELESIAAGISAKIAGSVARTKRLLGGDRGAVAALLEKERASFVEQIATAEAREGMKRFLGS